MKNLKRISVLALALILTIALGFATPQAAKAETDGYWKYTLSNNKATITGYTGNSANITVPSTVGGYAVVAIGNQAFYGHKKIENVVIPSGVTSIGNQAFAECKKLVRVTLPVGITSIGKQAFAGCKNLKEVIYGGTQSQWNELGVTLPAGVKLTCKGVEYSITGWEQTTGTSFEAPDAVGINGQPFSQNQTAGFAAGSTVTLSITPEGNESLLNDKAYLVNGGEVVSEVALTKNVNVWNGTFKMPAKDVKIRFATGHVHILTKVAAMGAGCTTPGNIEHYTCSGCDDLFADEAGATVVEEDDVLIPANGHRMTHHEYVAPSCTVAGVVEHWECEYCGNLYSDEYGNTVAADVTIAINPDAHDWGGWNDEPAPTVDKQGKRIKRCNLNENHSEEEVTDKLPLEIMAGANQTYTKGSGADIVIKTNGTAEFFADLTMNGSSIGVDHYDVDSGSTIVTLKAAYLDTLEEKTYEVGIAYLDDRMVKTNLTIAPAGGGNGNGTPQTGDKSPLIALGALLVFSGAGMLVILQMKRRRIRAGR